jgi:hypothetical protein
MKIVEYKAERWCAWWIKDAAPMDHALNGVRSTVQRVVLGVNFVPPMATPHDYSDAVLRRFPTDANLGFYAKPNLPTGKLGRALGAYTKLNPTDILAIHEYGNLFNGGSLAFTARQLWHPKGFINFEDIRSAASADKDVTVQVNQGGTVVPVLLRANSPQAAQLLVNVLDVISYPDQADENTEPTPDYEQAGFQHTEISWLKLRDEVLKTIDLLHQKFQDGKIGLQEWEDKKADLMARL